MSMRAQPHTSIEHQWLCGMPLSWPQFENRQNQCLFVMERAVMAYRHLFKLWKTKIITLTMLYKCAVLLHTFQC